jgi:hypothetical protein
VVGTKDEEASYVLPTINFADIISLDPSAAVFVANQLVTLGAVQITDIPEFPSARAQALSGVASCLEDEEREEVAGGKARDEVPGVASSRMADGSSRRTIAAARLQGRMTTLSSLRCGRPASRLRAVVDSTVKLFFRLLDSSAPSLSQFSSSSMHGVSPPPIQPRASLMAPSVLSFEEIAVRGLHLEHLHSYYPPAGSGDDVGAQDTDKDMREAQQDVMTLHTDSGLFVAMTSGFAASDGAASGGGGLGQEQQEEGGGRHDLYLQLPSGRVSRVVAHKDALIILAGEGAARWLQPVLGAPLRPAPHVLRRGVGREQRGGQTRAWFGMMVLPPPEALVPLRAGEQLVPYSEFRQKELRTGSETWGEEAFLASACVGGQRRLTSELCSRTDGSSGVMCWTQCQAVAELSCGTVSCPVAPCAVYCVCGVLCTLWAVP